LKFFPKSKPPPPPVEPDKDRLTVSLWPFKIDATGAGVQRAYVLAFTLCALWFASLVVYVLKPFPIPSPVVAVSGLVSKVR
jgi:hypothetical protein